MSLKKLTFSNLPFFYPTEETDYFFIVAPSFNYIGDTLDMRSIKVNHKTKEPRRQQFWKAPISLNRNWLSQA